MKLIAAITAAPPHLLAASTQTFDFPLSPMDKDTEGGQWALKCGLKAEMLGMQGTIWPYIDRWTDGQTEQLANTNQSLGINFSHNMQVT